jgi:hypothetical protein
MSYKGLEEYVQSFNAINEVNFDTEYDFKKIKKIEQLELLKPDDVVLTDYYNAITQFEIDLKTYNFYMNWTAKAAKSLIGDIEKEYQLADTAL